jgi:radical SAM superfamily enzyme YgiQ (UPF0313 family)
MSKINKSKKNSDMFQDFRNMIEEFQPSLIGFSALESTLEMTLELLHSIKDKKIPKLIGGMGVLFLRERIIKNDLIDMICIGEGEGAIVDLANAIRDEKDYSNIKNLWIKKVSTIIRNEPRNLVDLNTLPLPDWSIFEKSRFYKPMGGKLPITASIEDSRGCFRSCAYCCSKGQRDFYKSYQYNRYPRTKTVSRIMHEIKHAIKKFDAEYVFFQSQNFFIDRVKDFDQFIEEYGRIGIPFWCQTEPGSFTKEKLEQFKQVGCEGFSMGLEHGNEEFRRNILNRNMSNELLLKNFKIAEDSDIRVTVNNIIGFPTETRELIFDTINFNRNFSKLYTMVNLFAPYVGTKLRELSEQLGYIDKNTLCGDFRKHYYLTQPHISLEELLGLQRTFVLYAKMPKNKWEDIRHAEKFTDEGNRAYESLIHEFTTNSVA